MSISPAVLGFLLKVVLPATAATLLIWLVVSNGRSYGRVSRELDRSFRQADLDRQERAIKLFQPLYPDKTQGQPPRAEFTPRPPTRVQFQDLYPGLSGQPTHHETPTQPAPMRLVCRYCGQPLDGPHCGAPE